MRSNPRNYPWRVFSPTRGATQNLLVCQNLAVAALCHFLGEHARATIHAPLGGIVFARMCIEYPKLTLFIIRSFASFHESITCFLAVFMHIHLECEPLLPAIGRLQVKRFNPVKCLFGNA